MKKTSLGKASLPYPGLLKFARIMKLTTVCMLMFGLQVSAGVYSQTKISLNLEGVNIKKALSVIEHKSSYRFLYNQALLSGNPKVEVTAVNEDVLNVLDRMLNNTSLSYEVLDNYLIVIKYKGVDFQQTRVTGRVTDGAGNPLPGASIKIKGSSGGTSADATGNFALTVPDDAVLVISSVGFTQIEVPVAGKTVLNITLTEAKTIQDEVVVIGYGTASKRDLTGSIAKVGGKEVADKPNTNPISSLQSKVAGLSVVTNGTPGAQPDIRIRGTISIGSVHPLYVVDGIFNDNIDYLNPNDIESIEVLKDPSSLAIFGVKGAAGVIAITTKKAKAGQLLVNVNSTVGVKSLVDKIKLASGDQFRSILTQEGLNQAADNAGDTTISAFVANGLNRWPANTDWIDVLTQDGFYNTNNISVTGSSERNRFYMGIGYTQDEGLVKHVKYERISLSVNDEFKLTKSVKLGFNVNGTREKLPFDGIGPLNEARKIFPIVDAGTKSYYTRDPYGSLRDSANFDLYSGLPVLQNSLANPIMRLDKEATRREDIQYRIVGSVFAEINFLKKFNFRSTFYADLGNEDKREYKPLYDAYDPGAQDQTYPIFRAGNLSSVNQDKYDRRKFQGDYILTYKDKFGDHGLTVTGGITHYYSGFFQTHGEIKQKADDTPIPDDDRFWYITTGFGDQTTRVAASRQYEATTASGLLRFLYNYNSKYFLNVSLRRDGASGINGDFQKKFQNFWAVGAAWDITKENFMKDQTFFDYLKLKGSAGVLGNANTLGIAYPFYPTISATSSAVFGDNIVSAYNADYLPDPNLKWETVASQEIGIEFNALKNRLNFEMNYYNKTTKDLLVLLKPSGVLPTLTNNGEINNKGFEFTAGWKQSINKDLSFAVSGNLTTFKNEVVSIGYPLFADPQYPNQTLSGFPIGYFFGYVADGLYQNDADVANSPKNNVNGGNAKPGDFKYKDLSGPDGKPDGIIDDLDRTEIGNPTPDFSYGISATLNFKGIDFGVDVGGVSGNEIYRYWATSEQKNSVYNYPEYFKDAWHGDGTSNSIPIVNAKHLINRAPSTYGIENGSYFRIRNVVLGYNFSQDLLRKAHIKNLRIFANVQNLKTWKHNKGYSPEFGGSNSAGSPSITDNITDRTPSATSFGIDVGDASSAIPRVISFGLNVTF
jgi:TonB-linked SusC/RagA family outer membrane protein